MGEVFHVTVQKARFKMTAGKRIGTPDQRRFTRIAHGGAVKYRLSSDQQLEALCLDIGWGGAALRLGRYLRPGTVVEVLFTTPENSAKDVQGRLVWCRPIPGKSDFLAGLEANLEHGETVFNLSSVLLQTVSAGDANPVVSRCACDQAVEAPSAVWHFTRAAC
jgi:hypothetical protein